MAGQQAPAPRPRKGMRPRARAGAAAAAGIGLAAARGRPRAPPARCAHLDMADHVPPLVLGHGHAPAQGKGNRGGRAGRVKGAFGGGAARRLRRYAAQRSVAGQQPRGASR
jgi:hypothetical protein